MATRNKNAKGAPKRARRGEEETTLEASAPLAPPEPTDAEIAEALDALEPRSTREEDRFDDLLEDAPEEYESGYLAAGEMIAPAPDPVQPPRLVPPSASTLMAHCGANKISCADLALVPTPEPTRTHQPVAHIRVVETLVEALGYRHIGVVREEYAVTPDGGKMFGVLDLDYEHGTLDSFGFSIGIRNSNDKTMRLGVTIGYRVFVCDNMAFKGDFTPVLAKHSRRLDLEEVIALGVDRMQRGFAPLKRQIGEWQQQEVTDERAKLLIYEAFLERGLPVPRHLMHAVHRHYFQPQYEAFRPRTLWSLANAFTSAFKELRPVRQFQATAKLGGFIARHEPGGASTGGSLAAPLQAQPAFAVLTA